MQQAGIGLFPEQWLFKTLKLCTEQSLAVNVLSSRLTESVRASALRSPREAGFELLPEAASSVRVAGFELLFGSARAAAVDV